MQKIRLSRGILTAFSLELESSFKCFFFSSSSYNHAIPHDALWMLATLNIAISPTFISDVVWHSISSCFFPPFLFFFLLYWDNGSSILIVGACASIQFSSFSWYKILLEVTFPFFLKNCVIISKSVDILLQ